MNQKTTTLIVGGVAVIIFGAFIARGFVNTTTDITIKNDTSQVVAVSGCGNTSPTAQPAEQVDVRIAKTAESPACTLRTGGTYLGCLALPSASSGTEVSISAARKDVTESSCATHHTSS